MTVNKTLIVKNNNSNKTYKIKKIVLKLQKTMKIFYKITHFKNKNKLNN